MKLTLAELCVINQILWFGATSLELADMFFKKSRNCAKVHLCKVKKKLVANGFTVDSEPAPRMQSVGKQPLRYFIREDQKDALLILINSGE